MLVERLAKGRIIVTRDIELAIASTGLSLSQVKIKKYIANILVNLPGYS